MARDPVDLYQNYPTYDSGILEDVRSTTGSLPDPTVNYNWSYEGYVFAGWNTSRDGSGTTSNIGDDPDPILVGVYYAIWRPESSGSSLAVTYNGNTIHTSTESETFALPTSGKLMATDITISATDIDSYTVSYNGSDIISSSGTETKTLSCGGKVMADDIRFAVEIGIVPVVYPAKGDIITINGVSGTWRVLKINSSVAEVLAQFDYANNTFASSGNLYENSNLDTRLNTTYYNTLSSTVRAAIVDKTIRQDRWYVSTTGNPVYIGTYNTSTEYKVSLNNASYGNEIIRHVYAISIQDIIDYLEVTPQMTASSTTLNRTNMRALYGGATSGACWTRTAYAGNNNQALIANMTGRIQSGTNSSSYKARPCFQIDLSKVNWIKV